MNATDRADFQPFVRQVTGAPRLHYAYVVQRGNIVERCPTNHRSYRTALACAERMTRRYRRAAVSQPTPGGDDRER